MNKITLFIVLSILIFACKSNENKDNTKEKATAKELKSEINKMNDSLKVIYADIMKDPSKEIPSLTIIATINSYLEFYRNYPQDPFAPECLDKVQQLYLQDKTYEMSLAYTDTLLKKYPHYKEKATLLLNAGSSCEMTNERSRMKKYYTQLLKEFPKLDKETKEMVEFRLKHIDLSFDQLIELQMKNVGKN